MSFRSLAWGVRTSAYVAITVFTLSGPVVAELPSHEKILETFDRTALNAQVGKAGVIRKWVDPIRYRIEGLTYDQGRIALSVAALKKTAALAGVPVREAEQGERENFILMFRNVAYFDVGGFKASCVAYWRASPARGEVLYQVRLDINLAADPDISRCIYHEALHGLGLFGHPDRVDSVLSYGARNITEPSELDALLIRLLYDPDMRPGMGRLPALLTAHRILLSLAPDAAGLPVAYIDEVVKQLRTAAEQGNVAAQRQLAEAYRQGHHVAPDEEAAARWEALSQPVRFPPGKAPHDDARLMPFNFGGMVYEGYSKYLSRTDRPRFFAIAPSGSWGWSSGYRNAEERALATCQQYTRTKCVIYSAGEEVVWKPAETGPYADEDSDWGVIPEAKLRSRSKSHGPTPRHHATVRTMQTDELRNLLSAPDKKPLLLDVLYGDHWSLPGARQLEGLDLIDLTDVQKERVRHAVQALRRGDDARPIVTFCSSAYCWLSYNAALILDEIGVKNVHWFRGGIAAWRAAGLPLDWPNRIEPF